MCEPEFRESPFAEEQPTVAATRIGIAKASNATLPVLVTAVIAHRAPKLEGGWLER